MATLTTNLHDEGQATAQDRMGSQTLYDRYALAAGLALNDVIRSVYIPKGAVLLDALIATPDLDSNATETIALTLRVNDGTTQKNFFASSTVGEDGGVQRADAIPGAIGYEVTTEGFYLELLVATGPATAITTGTIELQVTYTMNLINED